MSSLPIHVRQAQTHLKIFFQAMFEAISRWQPSFRSSHLQGCPSFVKKKKLIYINPNAQTRSASRWELPHLSGMLQNLEYPQVPFNMACEDHPNALSHHISCEKGSNYGGVRESS